MNYLNLKNKAYTKGNIKYSDPNRSCCVRRTSQKERSKRANELLKTISRMKATR